MVNPFGVVDLGWSDGAVWSVGADGLIEWRADGQGGWFPQDPLVSGPLWSIHMDTEGRIWAGGRGFLVSVAPNRGLVERFVLPESISRDAVTAISSGAAKQGFFGALSFLVVRSRRMRDGRAAVGPREVVKQAR